MRVWVIRNLAEYWNSAKLEALQENEEEDTNDGISLLTCLTGHTGNIHTVAFSPADMLVTPNIIFYHIHTSARALLIFAAPQLHIWLEQGLKGKNKFRCENCWSVSSQI